MNSFYKEKLIGAKVIELLGMHDAPAKEVIARVECMRLSLAIISTWSACDELSQQSHAQAMSDIRQRALQGLGKA